MMEMYELVKDIGSGNFGVARLMRNKDTGELVAMKYIPRGPKVRSLLPFSSSGMVPIESPDCGVVPSHYGCRRSTRTLRGR